LVAALKILEDDKDLSSHVCAFDINFGCPVHKATKGKYGSILLDNAPALAENMITECVAASRSLPITAKVRLIMADKNNLSFPHKSIELYDRFIRSGVSMIAVHGRHRKMVKAAKGKANHDGIAQVNEALGDRIPIVANGSMRCFQEMQQVAERTKCPGIMVAEGALYDPTIFEDPVKSGIDNNTTQKKSNPYDQLIKVTQISLEYLEIAKSLRSTHSNRAPLGALKKHIQQFFSKVPTLKQNYPDYFDQLHNIVSKSTPQRFQGNQEEGEKWIDYELEPLLQQIEKEARQHL